MILLFFKKASFSEVIQGNKGKSIVFLSGKLLNLLAIKSKILFSSIILPATTIAKLSFV